MPSSPPFEARKKRQLRVLKKKKKSIAIVSASSSFLLSTLSFLPAPEPPRPPSTAPRPRRARSRPPRPCTEGTPRGRARRAAAAAVTGCPASASPCRQRCLPRRRLSGRRPRRPPWRRDAEEGERAQRTEKRRERKTAPPDAGKQKQSEFLFLHERQTMPSRCVVHPTHNKRSCPVDEPVAPKSERRSSLA